MINLRKALIYLHAIILIAFFLPALMVQPPKALAQSESGFVYISQLNDTLPLLAEKYLGDATQADAIIVLSERIFGVTVPQPLPPGLILFIPNEPLARTVPTETPTQPPTSTPEPIATAIPTATPIPPPPSGPEPFGKIAFSFYNRALSRRVWEIDLINADGSGRQVIRWNEVGEPALSPDGTHLAFRGWSGNDTGRVLSVGPITGERHWPTGSFQEDSRPDWSHDGSRLVFSSQREGDRLWRLYLIHADGQNERSLQRADGFPLFGEDPAWAHGDNRIIYRGCAFDGSQCGIWFITLDGVVSAPIAVDSTAIQPDGSPTADQVVFASSQSGNWEIYRANLDGSGLQPLTNHPAIDGMPTWSPDGEWIAFQSTRPGFAPATDVEQGPSQGGQSTYDNWGIWIMRKDGTDLRQVMAFDGGLMKANRLDLPYGSRDWYDEQISWGR